jgi:virulence-associated protein VapD
MYALAFDLELRQVRIHRPGHVSGAYTEIRTVLESHGFQWTQGSLYILEDEDMSILFRAITALMVLPWFPPGVRDIRAFRVEQWSNFTSTVKGQAGPPGRRGGSSGGTNSGTTP